MSSNRKAVVSGFSRDVSLSRVLAATSVSKCAVFSSADAIWIERIQYIVRTLEVPVGVWKQVDLDNLASTRTELMHCCSSYSQTKLGTEDPSEDDQARGVVAPGKVVNILMGYAKAKHSELIAVDSDGERVRRGFDAHEVLGCTLAEGIAMVRQPICFFLGRVWFRLFSSPRLCCKRARCRVAGGSKNSFALYMGVFQIEISDDSGLHTSSVASLHLVDYWCRKQRKQRELHLFFFCVVLPHTCMTIFP